MNQEVLQAFYDDNCNQFSSETIRSYKISLSQFFSESEKNYDEVRAKDIRNWLANLSEKGLKIRSIQLKLTALKSFYQYCIEENKINHNPTKKVKTPKSEDLLPYYLNKRQLALLQELTKDNLRERAIVEVLYATGVRINELLNIKLEDIKWDTRQIWIRKGKGNKDRFVLFSHECALRLKNYLHVRYENSDFLFSSPRGKHISCTKSPPTL